MKFSHRIRAYMLKREANALLRRASRPHKQSGHMIGRSRRALNPDALVGVAVAIALLVAFNLVLTEPVPADRTAPAQVVANQK
jgi:hypothetical protein